MSPAAECWAAYRGDIMLFAFAAGGGPILGSISDAPPLYAHPVVRGRLLIAGLSDPIGDLVKKKATVEAVIEALRAAGYAVHPTPAESLRWALGGLI